MNRIISKEQFSEKVTKLVVEAPLIAKARRAGHFVIVRCGDNGERIPLTIVDSDVKNGTITLVIQAVGDSTKKICPDHSDCDIKKRRSCMRFMCDLLFIFSYFS